MIVEVAADLATGKWLLSEFREDHEGMVTRATMRKIRGQNEAMRRQAIKLRAAFDALAPLFDTVEQQARELAAKDAMARAVDSVFAAWLDNDEPAIAAALGRLFAARDGVPDTADARTIAELSGATDRLIDRAERAERDLSAARAAIAALCKAMGARQMEIPTPIMLAARAAINGNGNGDNKTAAPAPIGHTDEGAPIYSSGDLNAMQSAALAPLKRCPDGCGRPKARNAVDCVAGCCSKWYAPKDRETHAECARLAAFWSAAPAPDADDLG